MLKTVKKVALVCHSDLLGGAAVVTYRLMDALRAEGIDARMVVFNKVSDSENVYVAGSGRQRKAAFLAERLRIFTHNGFSRKDLFKVSIANTGLPLWRHPWILEADVVNLNWINQGLLSLDGIRKIAALGKPIVWTMHDMWCMTGVCHHAHSCTRFEGDCGKCYQLNSHRNRDLSFSTHIKKQALYAQVPIHFVAVSNWLAGRCRESSLMRDADLRVIPNAFPVETFATEVEGETPELAPLVGKRLIIMGAARLDDPIKGFDSAIEALNLFCEKHPKVAENVGVVFFGVLRDPSLLNSLKMPYLHLGRIESPALLRRVYAAGIVVLSTSKYETLPGTLIEGQAAGCVPVTFGNGGQADIVDHMQNGYIARGGDVADLVEGLHWAFETPLRRDVLHQNVERRFSASVVARRYIEVYQCVLSGRE